MLKKVKTNNKNTTLNRTIFFPRVDELGGGGMKGLRHTIVFKDIYNDSCFRER